MLSSLCDILEWPTSCFQVGASKCTANQSKAKQNLKNSTKRMRWWMWEYKVWGYKQKELKRNQGCSFPDSLDCINSDALQISSCVLYSQCRPGILSSFPNHLSTAVSLSRSKVPKQMTNFLTLADDHKMICAQTQKNTAGKFSVALIWKEKRKSFWWTLKMRFLLKVTREKINNIVNICVWLVDQSVVPVSPETFWRRLLLCRAHSTPFNRWPFINIFLLLHQILI